MVTKVVHLSEEEYQIMKEGLSILVIITELCKINDYDEIIAGRIYDLLWDKKYEIEQVSQLFPFEGSREDLLWWLKEVSKRRERNGQSD